jgi:outer membrane protein assembly factor BamB
VLVAAIKDRSARAWIYWVVVLLGFPLVGRSQPRLLSKQWSVVVGRSCASAAAIASDGSLYFGSFYALAGNGSKTWQFQTGRPIVSSAAIGRDGVVYFGSHDGRLYALRPNGAKVWEYATGGPILSSPAIDADGTLYFTSVDGFFYALKTAGSLKWRLRTGGITESSPVIGQDGTLYVGVNTSLWAINPEGGKKWEQGFIEPVEVTPAALADNSVCCVSHAGSLCDYDKPGEPRWMFFLNGFGSPAVGAKGTIYDSGSSQGVGATFQALDADVPLAESSWPKLRGNPPAVCP